jgi:hypothetical protein
LVRLTVRILTISVLGVFLMVGAAFAQDYSKNSVKGAYVLDKMGRLYTNGDVGSGTAFDVGFFFGTASAVDIELTPTGNGLWLLDQFGGLHTPGGDGMGGGGNDAIKIFTDPLPGDETNSAYAPYFSVPVAVDMECIPQSVSGDNTTWGLMILDHNGGVHSVGPAVTDVVPYVTATPYFGFDVARDLEITATGQGLFVLDGYGAVHASGDALSQIPDPYQGLYVIPYFNFDIAKDLELALDTPLNATPETGWYVLDGFGGVHTQGFGPVRSSTAAGDNVFISEAMDNVYFWFDIARDFEVGLDETMFAGDEWYYQLDGSGGIHPKENYPFSLEDLSGDPLHYFQGMDIAVDFEFLRETP